MHVYSFDWNLASDALEYHPDEARGPAAVMPESGRAWLDAILPKDRDAYRAALDGLTPERPLYRIRYRRRAPSGGYVQVEEHGRAHFDSRGVRAWITGMGIERATPGDAAFFRRIVDSSLSGLYLCDLETGRNSFVNPSYSRLTGYSGAEITAMSRDELLGCFHPDDRARVQAHLERLRSAADGTVLEIEYRFRRRDGAWIWCLSQDAVFDRDADGAPRRAIGTFLDISARKAAERGLRAHLAEIETIYASAPVGLCALDAELRFVRINERLAEINGISVEGHVGRTLRETLPAMADSVEPLLQEVIRTGEPKLNMEVRGETPARPGVLRSWIENWLPLKDAQGRVTGINIVAAEVTDLRRTRDALRESEERFHLMAETVPDILFTADANGYCNYFNARFFELTGLPRRTAGLGWMEALHPDDRERAGAVWRASVESGEAPTCTYRLRALDGSYRWFQARARPVRDEAGVLIQWFGVVTDIHELVSAHEALKEADRRKNEFLAVLGHELRNPMAPIRSAVDAIGLMRVDNPELGWALRVIDRQSLHMSRLLDDLLDVSRIVRGKLVLQRRPVELKTLIEDAVEEVGPAIDERDHRLTLDLPPSPMLVDGDPVRLSQILVNLLSNAAKYTPPGGRIQVSGEASGQEVTIRVRDNGQGMSPQLIDHIFEAFSQGERALDRAPGGLGLGLTIASRLAEMHGGRLEAESPGLGQGAEFRLYLPRPSAPMPEEQQAPAQADTSRLRVLVVDDNPDVALGMGMLLRLMGHEVRTAGSGQEGLEAAAEWEPRVVFLDIGMTGMNGLEAASRLRRSWPDPARMRLVAVTGYADEGFRIAARAAGFDDHLAKPVDRERLEDILRAVEAESGRL